MSHRRVVITGLGAICPIACGAEPFWEALLAGTNGMRPLEGFDTSGFRTKYGGQVRGFEASSYFPEPSELSPEQMGRGSQFAVAATRMAFEHARLDWKKLHTASIGASLGTTVGECKVLEEIDLQWTQGGPESVDSKLFGRYPSGTVPMNVARIFGLRGPNMMIPTACAAGNYAIGFGYDAIREGRCKAMVVGGSDPFSLTAFAGFNRLLACAPEKVQPFDRNRKGMMVSEGAGVLLLEDLSHAVERGAPIVAELLGYGLSCDAHHMTQPDPEGRFAALSTARALEASGRRAEEVDYFCAHGTGTPANDRVESMVVKQLFGDRAAKVPLSSIKSMLGHCMGAASALEAVATALAVRHDVIPPTINFETADPECEVDCVPNVARPAKVRLAVSNAYGFGGNNACIVVGKWEGA
ncbi:MAG: beta-ketoacyl-[acyl-carrier-protein] synthase family protein [Myxococcales bacterium]|nr:beta-ketoacyl-[acyl-carrier-protein] synthase family protein [Myxococcales bacterium]